ncbi:MAG: histidine phosphatase family protein [Myxococcota bacterium]
MTTRVLLVRHGATTLTAEDRFAGSTDVLLSETGERQAQALAERLRDAAVTAVYSSPMRRTIRTAEILALPHNLTVQRVDALREIDHGRWEQRTRAEVEREYGEEYASWEEDPFTFAPVGGESGLAVLARALPAVRELVQRHPNQTVLVVSHKATIRLLIGSLLGFDLRGYRDRLDQQPCCLNVLDFKDATRARLMLFNDVSHYENQPTPRTSALSKWWDTKA